MRVISCFGIWPAVVFESKVKQYGLIAEEVDKIMPDIVVYDEDKKPHSVQYHILPAILLSEIQKLNKRIEALEKK